MAQLEYGNRDNLFNIMNAHDPGGGLLDMSINLTERNDLIRDLPSTPANNNMTHKGVRWETLPTGTVTVVGGGWSASFGRLQPYREDVCIIKSRYQVPVDALKLEAQPDQYRDAQEKAHQEGMSQSWANTLMRGTDATAPEKIDGIQNRAPWNDITETSYVFDVGGASNLRSCWLINPGITKVHLIHPKTHPTFGVQREDMGKVFVAASTTDANASGNRWDYITEFEFWQGICIRDQRAVKRICNIDYALTAMTTDLIQKIIQARSLHEIGGNWFLYCDARIFTQLKIMAMDKNNVYYSSDNPYKQPLPMIDDIIIRRMDALNVDETAVA